MSAENCPILKAKGIPFSNGTQGHEICEDCPIYPGKCVHEVDLRGKNKERYIQEQLKERGERWMTERR